MVRGARWVTNFNAARTALAVLLVTAWFGKTHWAAVRQGNAAFTNPRQKK
jgi:hypothetical protein